RPSRTCESKASFQLLLEGDCWIVLIGAFACQSVGAYVYSSHLEEQCFVPNPPHRTTCSVWRIESLRRKDILMIDRTSCSVFLSLLLFPIYGGRPSCTFSIAHRVGGTSFEKRPSEV